ncbi:hypothetical protein ASG73_09220 [Janibacter sp. Soil728]|uniref:hypothetical protein n=1 Tax=Janibacter sp. Soil728 TaxID=1736393 RepID=UPI0006F5F264|nr:hypothetical protein [Janibacter sp. Soil728]KRE37805.1 hypothetical protein ASG73_09220 [Janibacter sp. Soil728]
MTSLRLADGESAADLTTYLTRAKRLDEAGDVRLQAVGNVLAVWTCVVPGRGLGSNGLVLGLRTFALAEAAHLDTTTPISTITDRLARGGTDIEQPPVTSQPTWRALSPPRSGWEPVGRVSDTDLAEVARAGIAEVAQGAPEGSGAAAVADLRSRVWGRMTQTVPPVPAGTAFGLHALGFLRPAPDAQASVHTIGPWTRVATEGGFVLAR